VAAAGALRRRIGLFSATGLVVGGTIGVGIFLTPAGMAKSLGSPALLFAVWAFLGLMALSGALCFGELAARFPEAGGSYVYLREAYGPGVAFLYGWKCLMVMDPGLTAALATGFAAYAKVLFPGVAPKLLGVAAIAVVAACNLAGVRLAASLAHALAVAKVVVLVLLVAFGFFGGRGDAAHLLPFAARRAGSPSLVGGLAGALVSGFFSFGGWWEASKLTGEVQEPERNMPRALALGVLVVTLLYVAVSGAFLFLVPLEAVGSGETFAAQAGVALFGSQGGAVLSSIVLLSVLGSLFAFMTMAPRVYYAMARDGAAPAWAAHVDPRTGAPVRAILVQGALAALLVVLGTFDAIVAYFVFVTVAFLGLTVAGLFRLRRRSPRATIRAPLFPLPALFFLACIGLVLGLLAAGRPLEAGLGVGVVALGAPLYRFRSRRPEADAALHRP
jgi:basic amino acid/polyamine antiporter, APA family